MQAVHFLDRHSGLLSSVGLILAALGLLLTLYYLHIYRLELRNQGVEQERLAWERILKLLHQIASHAALANLSSVTHSRLARGTGSLPPELAARYQSASESLLSYWHQLRVEMDIMPDSTLIDDLQTFVAKYDLSADSRASESFAEDLRPITHKVSGRARKSFESSSAEAGSDVKPVSS